MGITLDAFLRTVGGGCIRVENGCGELIYDADKNAIRAYHSELLEKEVVIIEAIGKNRLCVRLY